MNTAAQRNRKRQIITATASSIGGGMLALVLSFIYTPTWYVSRHPSIVLFRTGILAGAFLLMYILAAGFRGRK
jgi:hypothetical protein